MPINLDSSDRILLSHLQEDTRTSIDSLAEFSGLSVASVQRRLKKLRDNKIIEREIAVIDPRSVNQNMTFIVSVELEREQLDQLDKFRRQAKNEPQVQQCYYVTGMADFILICITKDMAEFETLTHRLFYANTNVRRFSTSVVMDRSKVGLFVQISDENDNE